MTAYSVQTIGGRVSSTPTPNTPSGTTGDTFPAGENIYLRFITTGTAVTVTVTPPAGGGPRGTTVAPLVLGGGALPATGVREFGPFPQSPFGDANGNVPISYSVITGLTVEVKNILGG
jgi:hypothetical protein